MACCRGRLPPSKGSASSAEDATGKGGIGGCSAGGEVGNQGGESGAGGMGGMGGCGGLGAVHGCRGGCGGDGGGRPGGAGGGEAQPLRLRAISDMTCWCSDSASSSDSGSIMSLACAAKSRIGQPVAATVLERDSRRQRRSSGEHSRAPTLITRGGHW